MAGDLDPTKTALALKSLFQSGYQAELTAINTAEDDDIVLENIKDYRLAPVAEHPAYPAAIFECVNQPKMDDARPYNIWTHRMQMLLIAVGDEGTAPNGDPPGLFATEVLSIRVKRMAKAAVILLEKNPCVGGNADNLFVDSVEYSEIIRSRDEENLFRKEALIEFRVMVSVA